MRQDPPTRAELAADEHGPSILDGMVRCPHGCPSYFHAHDTAAAIAHAASHQQQ